jgi:hypothetical protein
MSASSHRHPASPLAASPLAAAAPSATALSEPLSRAAAEVGGGVVSGVGSDC